MEALRTVLFEDPLGIYIALAIVGALGLVSYQSWRTLKSAWPTTLALIAAAAVFTISTLAVTDREKILAISDDIAEAINNGDSVAMERFLDKDFAGQNPYPTRVKAIRWLAHNVEKYEVTDVAFKILDLNIKDDLAIMVLQSNVTSNTFPVMRMNWRIIWARRSAGWLVFKVSGPTIGTDTAENEKEQT